MHIITYNGLYNVIKLHLFIILLFIDFKLQSVNTVLHSRASIFQDSPYILLTIRQRCLCHA